jgi:acetylornithine/succinyldiaminopimelate/putrescine aminotransferase
VAAVREQVGRLIHVPNTWYTEAQGRLAEALSERTGWGGQCFFCNSGTEANEAAIKLARLAGGPGRYKIVTTFNSFHGRTLGALSATGQPKYHQGLEPLLPGFSYAPFGDVAAAARLIDRETCAILVEPIQGEGGINLPPAGYLEGLRELADRHQLLLIFDEVQSGMGRTGRWYAHQHWNVSPDVVTLAKALAGGVACGGLIARPEAARHLRPGTHAATFGGNPLACAAALATIETIEADGLLERAGVLEARFRARFEALRGRCPWIKEVRARGVMIGLELMIDGAPFVAACLQRRLLINCTHGTVLRLLPALNLGDAELEEGCDILEDVLTQYKG